MKNLTKLKQNIILQDKCEKFLKANYTKLFDIPANAKIVLEDIFFNYNDIFNDKISENELIKFVCVIDKNKFGFLNNSCNVKFKTISTKTFNNLIKNKAIYFETL